MPAVFNSYQTCINDAHTAHNEALLGQDDGKPDFYSRKSCNYLQAAVVDCTEKLVGDCYTPDEVAAMQAQQFAGVLQQLEEVAEWDSDKCPASKKYKEGLDGETVEGSVTATTDDTQTPEGADPTDNVAPETTAEAPETTAEAPETTAAAPEDTPAAPTAEDTTENPPAGDTGAEGEGNGDDTSAAGALVAASLLVLLLARLV